jgi:hypothetical protein
MTLFRRPTSPGRPAGTDPVTADAGQHAVIELRGVSKHYGTGSGQPVAAADAVSFAIQHGASSRCPAPLVRASRRCCT